MARSVWKGTLSFGLVTIGVELLTAESPERIDLDMLDKRDMSRIGYQKINKSTGEVVESKDIVRGYPVSRDRYVILNDADFKAANPEATQTIDVFGFVDASEVPPIYYAKPYLISPTKGSGKAYALFHETLGETGQVGIARLVVRTRQYMAAIYPLQEALAVQLLRYHDEVRFPAEAGVTVPESEVKKIRPAERQMAKRLMADMKIDWQPEEWHDEYREDLMKLVEARAKGAKPSPPVTEGAGETKVLDLMEALRRSVGGSSGKKPKSAAKKSKPRSRKSA